MTTSSLSNSNSPPSSNFWMLASYEPELAKLGAKAEKYFAEDPNTCLIKIRQFGELLARTVAAYLGIYANSSESQMDLLRRLESSGKFPKDVASVFHNIRKIGNSANHNLAGSQGDALSALKMAWVLTVWYHQATKDSTFQSPPFIPPPPPEDTSEVLQQELSRLRVELDKAFRQVQAADGSNEEVKSLLSQTQEEKANWERIALEAEKEKSEINAQLEALQSVSAAHPSDVAPRAERLAHTEISTPIDEAATRTLIDQQLRDAGWEADTTSLRYGLGTRPQKGRNMAIAEWPTKTGRADYVLFVGLTPLAAVEAKKSMKNVSEDIKQAKRYSKEFKFTGELVQPEGQPWGKEGEFKLPFGFSTNGRPYLKQLETHSGIWFVDMRRNTNLARALVSWYTPEGLMELFKQDVKVAEEKLEKENFDYNLQLRDYQKKAILKVEEALAAGNRICMLAMATGTGKTKTAMALMYRLLKTKRFRRILFVVDRFALGEQAATEFGTTQMESLQTFSDIFSVKDLEDKQPDKDTSVHVATIQGLIKRVLHSEQPYTIDQYDCIIVDECHRGYLLDRDLSDTELEFRDQDDYISNYRRVLEYFDAVKIGLTATPALHTTQIFGKPVFQYTYKEAVIDDVLVDHEPPINITTRLSEEGIKWKKGDKVAILNRDSNKLDFFDAPDEIKMDVEEFNKKVITENFNRVVCKELAKQIDYPSPEKTLFFCANDIHADLVVKVFKEELRDHHGEVDDDAVAKITSWSHKPLDLIKRYKNEKLPQFAVTVDLLTTGIDVPAITNLVFIRRVNSRILYEQMLGRATRKCKDFNKEVFRIYDAVGIYETMQQVSDMKPVVVNPKITFSELGKELHKIKDQDHLSQARDQFIAKLVRKKRHLSERQVDQFEKIAGQSINAFIKELKSIPTEQIYSWFLQAEKLTEILDSKSGVKVTSQLVSQHDDELVNVSHGYGRNKKPEDYLEEFQKFIRDSGNNLPALQVVLQRPRDLTRKELKSLILALDEKGFDERTLDRAWSAKTNKEMAARIIGFIRQAALGDPLKPWSERVDNALRRLLSGRTWTNPQRQWLEKIAAQTKANLVVDRETMDTPDQFFQREAGGFNSLNKKFDGKLEEILHEFNELIWNPDVA